MIQIETRGALDDVDDIARLPGVDALFVGPYDLGVALGVHAGRRDPRGAGGRRPRRAGRPRPRQVRRRLPRRSRARPASTASSASRSSAPASRARCWPARATRSWRRCARDPALVRIGMPAAIAAAGVVFLIAGEGENDQGAGRRPDRRRPGGAAAQPRAAPGRAPRNRDREREEAAREHFDRTGRWPDEELSHPPSRPRFAPITGP